MINEPALQIGLSAWIIQDGNYSDFECGTERQFALEFYFEQGLKVTGQTPSLIHQEDGMYAASGVVTFADAHAWVVNFGGTLAYREERPPDGIARGTAVSGEISLGVDPFFYFESLCHRPQMPPLIYRWQVESIEIETAPFIETGTSLGHRLLVRDQSKRRRVSIARTDAWNDDGGHGDYLMSCRRLSDAPVRSFSNR